MTHEIPIHVVDVDDVFPSLSSSVGQCSRCYLEKELGETVIYVFPNQQGRKHPPPEAYDICKDCLPFVKAVDGNPEVEEHRKMARENPYTSKEWDGKLAPYQHCDKSRWTTLKGLWDGNIRPNFNMEGEPPIPGVTLWLKGTDEHNNSIWEDRKPAQTVSGGIHVKFRDSEPGERKRFWQRSETK